MRINKRVVLSSSLSIVREITVVFPIPSPCPLPSGARVHWTVISRTILTFNYVVGMVLLAASLVPAQDPFVLESRGGLEVWSVPQPAPGEGYEATKIVLKGVDPASQLVAFENLRFDGAFVQTWLSGPLGVETSKDVFAGPSYPAEWIPFDSHVLITSRNPRMISGSEGCNFHCVGETNDMSLGQIPGLPLASGTPSVSGFGPIAMAEPTGVFFLDSLFQRNEIDLAYLVRQSDASADSDLTMTLGVLGSGMVSSGEPGGASFGFNGNDPVLIRFIPEPTTSLLAIAALVATTFVRGRPRFCAGHQ